MFCSALFNKSRCAIMMQSCFKKNCCFKFYFMILVKSFSEGIQLSVIEEPDIDISQSNVMINYVYYSTLVTWNEARAVCGNIGGDLAKVDSETLKDIIINLAIENYQTNIFTQEYWIGLVAIQNDYHRWVSDCSPLHFGENFPASWKDYELCFRMRKDHTGERRRCDTRQGFLCEVKTEIPCTYVTRLDTRFLSMGTNISGCKSQCSDNIDCWATVEMSPDECIMLAPMDLGIGVFHLSSKFCLNVTFNETNAVVIENNSYIPGHNCSDSEYIPTITPTPSSVFGQFSSPVEVSSSSTLCPSIIVYSSICSITLTATSIITSFAAEQFSCNKTYTETIHATSTEFYTVTPTVSPMEQNNYTVEEAESLAKRYVKNLTVNSKSTGAYMRRLVSADDSRTSVKCMGIVGIIAVIIPMTILFLPDLKNLFMHIRLHHSIYSRRYNQG